MKSQDKNNGKFKSRKWRLAVATFVLVAVVSIAGVVYGFIHRDSSVIIAALTLSGLGSTGTAGIYGLYNSKQNIAYMQYNGEDKI